MPPIRQRGSPVGIEISIEQNPLRVVIRDIGQLAHVVGQQAILPLTSGHVDIACKINDVGKEGMKNAARRNGTANSINPFLQYRCGHITDHTTPGC